MRVAVVIPAFDEEESIVGAIASAAAGGVEVIVADGGSLDGTRDRAEAAGARVVRSPKGRAQQLEAGVHASDADVLLLLHADTRLPDGFTAAIDAFAGSDVAREALGDGFVDTFVGDRHWQLEAFAGAVTDWELAMFSNL